MGFDPLAHDRHSWIAHGLVAVAASLVCALVFGLTALGWAGGYVVGAGGSVLYFVWREGVDAGRHVVDGQLPDRWLDDRTGDLLAPVGNLFGAAAANLLHLL